MLFPPPPLSGPAPSQSGPLSGHDWFAVALRYLFLAAFILAVLILMIGIAR
jgi:hypothetical protein